MAPVRGECTAPHPDMSAVTLTPITPAHPRVLSAGWYSHVTSDHERHRSSSVLVLLVEKMGKSAPSR